MSEYREDNLWGRVMDSLDNVIRYITLNLAWLALTLPVIVVFFLILRFAFGMESYPWVSVVLPIIFAAPALGGLYYATNQLAHGAASSIFVFWEGVKTYLWPSYRWGVLNLLAAFLLSVNIWFYGNLDLGIAPFLRIGFIVISVFWATLQIYVFPFILEQNEPSLKMALRNSFIAMSRFPLQSFGLAFLIALIVLLSTFVFLPLWLAISMSLITYLSNRLTISILEKLLALEQKNAEAPEE